MYIYKYILCYVFVFICIYNVYFPCICSFLLVIGPNWVNWQSYNAITIINL